MTTETASLKLNGSVLYAGGAAAVDNASLTRKVTKVQIVNRSSTYRLGVKVHASKRSAAIAVARAAADPAVLNENETQRLTATGTPTSGTFTITFSGQTTAAIAHNATAATIVTALEALSNIEAGELTGSGGAINSAAVNITFGGQFANTNVALMTTNAALLINGTEPTLTPATTVAGVAAVNEVQLLTPGGTISGGTWTITFSSQTTSALQWDANAATISAALDALSNLANGDCVATGGPISTGVVTLTFSGAGVAGSNVAEVTVDVGSLTGAAPALTPTTSVAGVVAVNEVQTLTPAGSPTGGTYTITYSGQTTSALAATATAVTVQAALSALSNLNDDAVVVTGGPISAAVLTLTYSGSGVAATNVAEHTATATGLTNATEPTVAATTPTGGVASVAEVITIPPESTVTVFKSGRAMFVACSVVGDGDPDSPAEQKYAILGW